MHICKKLLGLYILTCNSNFVVVIAETGWLLKYPQILGMKLIFPVYGQGL